MAPRWPQGRPELDPGARWPRSCATASGTPCALARGHRGPGNGIKQRETDGDSVTRAGDKEGIESRQEKSFSGWSENYLLREEERRPRPTVPPVPAPAHPGAPPPHVGPVGSSLGGPTGVCESGRGADGRVGVSQSSYNLWDFPARPRNRSAPSSRSVLGRGRKEPGGWWTVDGNPPGKILAPRSGDTMTYCGKVL